MDTNYLQSQAHYKVVLPIVSVDTDFCDAYVFLKAQGLYKNQEIGFNLYLNPSFKAIYDVVNGDIKQTISYENGFKANGMIMSGGEDILNSLMNNLADVWQLPLCPVTNDLNCDAYLLWGDILCLKSFETTLKGKAVIEIIKEEFVLSVESPRDFLRFKAMGLYGVRSKEDLDRDQVEAVPFFINIDLNKMLVEVEEKDPVHRDMFLHLFRLDATCQEQRLENKGRVMLITKIIEQD